MSSLTVKLKKRKSVTSKYFSSKKTKHSSYENSSSTENEVVKHEQDTASRCDGSSAVSCDKLVHKTDSTECKKKKSQQHHDIIVNDTIDWKPSLNNSERSEALSENMKIPWQLSRTDFQKTGIPLSKYLLGKILVRKSNNQILCGRIVETEAYLGEPDKACHAYGGKKTERTKTMYMAEGTAYVYSIYGMYHCLNMSSSDPGGCTLIRALEPLKGIDAMLKKRSAKRKDTSPALKDYELCNGPSKLCVALDITKQNLNAVDMGKSSVFYLLDDGVVIDDNKIVTCKRIGIDGYGTEWASKPYRFYVLNNKSVSVRNKEAEKKDCGGDI